MNRNNNKKKNKKTREISPEPLKKQKEIFCKIYHQLFKNQKKKISSDISSAVQ